MINKDAVISAALSVLFSEFWQYIKGIFGNEKATEEKPTRISIGDLEIELSSASQRLQERLKAELNEVQIHQVKAKTQSFRKACNRLIEIERQLDGQQAGDESPVLETDFEKQKEKVKGLAKDLKMVLEDTLGGKINPA